MAWDAGSNEATMNALDGALHIINTAKSTVTQWEMNGSGSDLTSSARTARLATVTGMDSDAVAAFLVTAKAWDGSVSGS